MIALLIIAVVVIVIVVYNVNKAVKQGAEKKKIREKIAMAEKLCDEGRPVPEADSLTQKYMERPIVIKIAQDVLQDFLKGKIELYSSANVRIRQIEFSGMIHAAFYPDASLCNGVYTKWNVSTLSEGGICFAHQILQPISTQRDMESCVRAVAILAYRAISRECSEDKTVKDYQLSMREFISDDVVCKSVNFEIRISYSAPNPNYAPPAEW